METAPTYAGVDVAKEHLDVVLRPSGEYLRAANDEQEIRGLVRRLSQEGIALAVVEATGGLERPLVASLCAAGLPVAVVNPRQVRDFAKAVGRLAKTDRIDASVLARFAEAVRPEPRPLPDGRAAELSALVGRRRQLLDMGYSRHTCGIAPLGFRVFLARERTPWRSSGGKGLTRPLSEAVLDGSGARQGALSEARPRNAPDRRHHQHSLDARCCKNAAVLLNGSFRSNDDTRGPIVSVCPRWQLRRHHASVFRASVDRTRSVFGPLDGSAGSIGGAVAPQRAARSGSAGSTACPPFQASKPPSSAAASNPILLSLRAARALVASSGQVQ